MLIEAEDASMGKDLDVVALSVDAWRVTDKNFATKGHGLLAYVQRSNGEILISIFDPAPVTELRADCWETALALLSRHASTRRVPEH